MIKLKLATVIMKLSISNTH